MLLAPTFPTPKKFAFLIHFRYDIRDDLKLYWKPLQSVPESIYDQLFQKYEFPSVKWSSIRNHYSQKVFGRNEIIPLNAKMFLKMGHERISNRVNKVLDKLVDKGYEVAGLGALTAPLTKGGLSLARRKDICLTNGNAYTAVILYQALKKLVKKNPDLSRCLSIVGATGSVGSCLARLVAKRGLTDKLMIMARNENRLYDLKKELKTLNSQLEVEVTNDMQMLRNAGLVTLLTTSVETILKPQHLKPGAVVLDGTQPRNTSAALLQKRPDVTIVDGGIVSIPGLDLLKGGFGLPEHHYFACFSETALLAIEGYDQHFGLGRPSLQQAEFIEKLAEKHRDYGFQLAPFLSFGEPLKNVYYK